MHNKELKTAIIRWLIDHEHEWQRVNACTDVFRAYIYAGDGNYLAGGQSVAAFIRDADRLLYPT